MELPPRARRIHDEDNELPRYIGTTSACAENTSTGRGFGKGPWNYLRVRGEYFWAVAFCVATCGTTSACAENTLNELGLL